jgi:acyl dehydratase
MKTIEITQPASTAAMYFGALRGGGKKGATAQTLPALTLVRPTVTLAGAHLAQYAKVCGFTPAHGVPITYPQLLTFPLVMAFFALDECPWPAMGTVHLANRIVQHQALHAGDTLRVEVSTGALLAHEKGQVFELDLRILRRDELVWQATQSLLRLGVKQPAGTVFGGHVQSGLPLSHQADFSAPANIGRRYGSVSGDRNPIHLWALSARLFGFRRAIAHGMWTHARALAALLPREPLSQAEVAVDFKTPLFLPARASLWTRHQPQTSSEAGVLFEVRNSKGDKPHLRGQLSYFGSFLK